MTNCYYVIKLPNQQELRIPAGFGTIEKTEDLKDLKDKLSDLDKNDNSETLNEIINTIYGMTPRTVISLKDVESIVVSTVMNEDIANEQRFDEIIDSVNKSILTNQDSQPLELAIRKLVSDGKVSSVKETLEKIDSVDRDYLKNTIKLDGVFNAIKFSDRLLSLNSEIDKITKQSIYNQQLVNLGKFLSSADRFLGNSILYNTDSEFGRLGLNVTNDIMMYSNNNSLFLSVFKNIASQLRNELEDVIGDDRTFFTNRIVKGRVEPSKFDELLKDKSKKSIISKIITTVSDKLGGGLEGVISDLIAHHSGNEIDAYNDRLDTIDELNSIEQEATKFFRNFDYSQKHLSRIENEGFFYSEIKMMNKDLYKNAKKYLKIGQDLVEFSYEGGKEYAVITDIYDRPKQNGVYIRGVVTTVGGDIIEVSNVFRGNDTIKYKSYEQPKWRRQHVSEIRKGSELKVSPEIIKNLVRIGDEVNGKVVSGIYPGFVYTTNNESIPYSKINKFKSQLAHNTLANMSLTKEGWWDSIMPGDYITINTDNQAFKGNLLVLDVVPHDKVFVYNGKDTAVFDTHINNETTLLSAYKNINDGNFDLDFINSEKVSTFYDINSSQTGDYGVSKYNGKEIIFKIVDSRSGRIISNLNADVDLYDLNDIKFYTDRDISSKTFLENLRVNRMLVESGNTVPEGAMELKYQVPSKFNLDNLVLLPDNYGNAGKYVGSISESNATVKDATAKMLSLINPKHKHLFVRKPTNKSYTMNTIGYIEITNVKNINFEDSNLLNVGNYIKLNNTYQKIVGKDGEFLILQENKVVDGDIYTNEFKVLESDAFDLLKSVLIRENNRSMGAVLLETNTELSKSQHRNRVIQVQQTIERNLKKIGVPLIYDVDGFDNHQKAKLEYKDGEVRIVLSKNDNELLIHETLHVYLTMLRHADLQTYDALMKTVSDSTDNIYDAEEKFVNQIAKHSKGLINLDFDTIETLTYSLVGILSTMDGINTKTLEDLNLQELKNHQLLLLNKSLLEFFPDIVSTDSKLLNYSLLMVEPAFRNWMKQENIILNCN